MKAPPAHAHAVQAFFQRVGVQQETESQFLGMLPQVASGSAQQLIAAVGGVHHAPGLQAHAHVVAVGRRRTHERRGTCAGKGGGHGAARAAGSHRARWPQPPAGPRTCSGGPAQGVGGRSGARRGCRKGKSTRRCRASGDPTQCRSCLHCPAPGPGGRRRRRALHRVGRLGRRGACRGALAAAAPGGPAAHISHSHIHALTLTWNLRPQVVDEHGMTVVPLPKEQAARCILDAPAPSAVKARPLTSLVQTRSGLCLQGVSESAAFWPVHVAGSAGRHADALCGGSGRWRRAGGAQRSPAQPGRAAAAARQARSSGRQRRQGR